MNILANFRALESRFSCSSVRAIVVRRLHHFLLLSWVRLSHERLIRLTCTKNRMIDAAAGLWSVCRIGFSMSESEYGTEYHHTRRSVTTDQRLHRQDYSPTIQANIVINDPPNLQNEFAKGRSLGLDASARELPVDCCVSRQLNSFRRRGTTGQDDLLTEQSARKISKFLDTMNLHHTLERIV